MTLQPGAPGQVYSGGWVALKSEPSGALIWINASLAVTVTDRGADVTVIRFAHGYEVAVQGAAEKVAPLVAGAARN
jgi:hypothetical protein